MSDVIVEPERVALPPQEALERAVNEWIEGERVELLKLVSRGVYDKSTVLKAHATGALGLARMFIRAQRDAVPVGVIVREMRRVEKQLKRELGSL